MGWYKIVLVQLGDCGAIAFRLSYLHAFRLIQTGPYISTFISEARIAEVRRVFFLWAIVQDRNYFCVTKKVWRTLVPLL